MGANDPRAANCRGFLRGSNGKVVGIHLVHVPLPSARYELALAELIDEEAAQGNTVVSCSVLNRDGLLTAERCFMGWPFPALDGEDSPAGPGNPNNQFAATSKFASSVIGPLAFFVGDEHGNPISDIIGGYGLPDGAHVSGRVTFRERVIAGDDGDGGDDDDAGEEMGEAVDALWAIDDVLERIATALERLNAHLGVKTGE